jgi:hypothetical protein
MSIDQTVSVAYGFSVKEDQIDAFLNELVEKVKNSGPGKDYAERERAEKAAELNLDPALFVPVVDSEQEEAEASALEDFLFSPETIAFINADPAWSSIVLSKSYDENTGKYLFVAYDSKWSLSIGESYESKAPTRLKDASKYDGPLLELVEAVGISPDRLGYYFWSVVY